MNIYKARWHNALKIAARINRFRKKGYLILDETGKRVDQPFHIRNKDELTITERIPGHVFNYLFFQNSKDWDHGLYTTIVDYNKRFDGWTMIHPSNAIKVLPKKKRKK